MMFAVLVLVIFGLIGWAALDEAKNVNAPTQTASGPEYGIGGGPPEPPNTGNTTVDDEGSLNVLLQEHAINTSFHLQDLYDGKNVNESGARLQDNANKLADFFANRVNIDRNEFLSMWNGHIREYENYTRAIKNNDSDGATKARENLSMHSVMMATELNRVVSSLPTPKIEQLMNQHIDLTLAVVDAHAAGDTAEKLSRSTQASTQAVEFADEIIGGIRGEED